MSMEILKSRPKQTFNNASTFWKKNNYFMLLDINGAFLNTPRDTAETFSKCGYSHILGVTWRIITGSKFHDWIYWTSLLQLQLIIIVYTLNSFSITNLSRYFFWFSDWSLVCSLLLLSTTRGFSATIEVFWPEISTREYSNNEFWRVAHSS
jgi:hypothetical protein